MTDRHEPPTDSDVEELLRRLGPEDLEMETPPSAVWENIVRDLDAEPAGAPVVSLDRHRRRRITTVLGAAAVLLVVVAAGLVIANRGDDASVVAVATLTYDEGEFDQLGSDASAEVSLVDDDGELYVRIDRSELPRPTDEDLELWLIEPDALGNPAGIVSLGLIDTGDPGRFALPDDLDPDVYVVVDISVEPRDGVASHSGRSILRGPLQQA